MEDTSSPVNLDLLGTTAVAPKPQCSVPIADGLLPPNANSLSKPEDSSSLECGLTPLQPLDLTPNSTNEIHTPSRAISTAPAEDEISRLDSEPFGITIITLLSIEPVSVSEATEDEENYTAPSKAELILYSRWPLTRKPCRDVGILAAVATFVTCTSIYYAYNASISPDPFVHILWDSSDITISTVNALTQLSIILLTELTQAVCESLRWSTLSRESNRYKGLPLLSFLALGQSTSLLGLFSFRNLLRLRTYNVLRLRKFRDLSYQSIAIQR
jgi:hypothetical protein